MNNVIQVTVLYKYI